MWGMESWGGMIWLGAPQVPLTSPIGLVVLVTAFICGAMLTMRSRLPRYLSWLSVSMLVVVPMTAYAALISMPYTFSNGTIADAAQVNANFGELVAESNDQDARIASLESQVAAFASQIAVLQSDVATNAAGVSSNTTYVSTAQADIATNVTAIFGNLTALATTQSDVSSNANAIAMNTNNVGINSANILNLNTTFAGVSRSGTLLSFSGMNVRVVSGAGYTWATPNGLGNLMVGYNENSGSATRTGSHNLVVGRYHEYTSYGGLVAGHWNTITGPYASVSGGSTNTASTINSSVSGGFDNIASGTGSSVTGGQANTARYYRKLWIGFDQAALFRPC